jgi:hypothetical protein
MAAPALIEASATLAFGADVENVGAIRLHAAGVFDRALRVEKLPAIGKAVGGDVENAHHQRPAEREQPR